MDHNRLVARDPFQRPYRHRHNWDRRGVSRGDAEVTGLAAVGHRICAADLFIGDLQVAYIDICD